MQEPNNNNNETNEIAVIIDETTPLLRTSFEHYFSPISTSTDYDGYQFQRPWSPSNQYDVISPSSNDNNSSSSSSSSPSSCSSSNSSFEIISNNSNEMSMPSSTDDVEVLDITDVAEMQLIDELKVGLRHKTRMRLRRKRKTVRGRHWILHQ